MALEFFGTYEKQKELLLAARISKFNKYAAEAFTGLVNKNSFMVDCSTTR